MIEAINESPQLDETGGIHTQIIQVCDKIIQDNPTEVSERLTHPGPFDQASMKQILVSFPEVDNQTGSLDMKRLLIERYNPLESPNPIDANVAFLKSTYKDGDMDYADHLQGMFILKASDPRVVKTKDSKVLPGTVMPSLASQKETEKILKFLKKVELKPTQNNWAERKEQGWEWLANIPYEKLAKTIISAREKYGNGSVVYGNEYDLDNETPLDTTKAKGSQNVGVYIRENYVDPEIIKKTGRNEPCPCGSGKKLKKCHG